MDTHDQIKELAKNYSTLLENMTDLNKKVKTLRDQKKDIEEQIMDFMEKHNLNTVDISNERFMIKETVKTKSFSKKTLVQDLLNFMNQHEVDAITSKLFTEDDATVSKTIKHKKI